MSFYFARINRTVRNTRVSIKKVSVERGSTQNYSKLHTLWSGRSRYGLILVKTNTCFQTIHQNGSKTIPFGETHTYIACADL